MNEQPGLTQDTTPYPKTLHCELCGQLRTVATRDDWTTWANEHHAEHEARGESLAYLVMPELALAPMTELDGGFRVYPPEEENRMTIEMRGISGNPGGAVDEETSDAIVDLLRDKENRDVERLRATYCEVKDDIDYEIVLASYPWDGQTRYAVIVSDSADFDVEDSGSREVAEAYYEQTVRDLTEVHMEASGEPVWHWSDVEGLPAGAVAPPE